MMSAQSLTESLAELERTNPEVRRAAQRYDETVADILKAVVRPPLRLTSIQPLEVLSQCKKAALKADVSLRWWTEFRATALACLGPEASAAETEKFLDVVRERFDVS